MMLVHKPVIIVSYAEPPKPVMYVREKTLMCKIDHGIAAWVATLRHLFFDAYYPLIRIAQDGLTYVEH